MIHRSLRILVLFNQDFEALSIHHEERESAASVREAARDVARALAARGHHAELLGIDGHDLPTLLQRLHDQPPELVFNLCESLRGDSRHEIVVPALLELLAIPYTGSAPLPLGLALHKDQSRALLERAGLPVPAGLVLPADAGPHDAQALIRAAALPYPLIVKPAREDASIGISAASVVHGEDALLRQVAALRSERRQPLLCEAFIEGRELSAALVGDPPRLLPLREIDFTVLPAGLPRIVCYRAKWAPESPECRGTRPVPAGPLSDPEAGRIAQAAQAAFAALGLRDYGRCDIRLSAAGVPYVIDLNPNCDLSATAGFAAAAREAGLSYEELVEEIALCAYRRSPHADARPVHPPR